MNISEQDVEKVAFSSRLELTAEDKIAYTKSLNVILDYINVLNKLDTRTVEPVGHVLPYKNVFREDERQPSLAKELVLANAPEIEEGMFKVPRII